VLPEKEQPDRGWRFEEWQTNKSSASLRSQVFHQRLPHSDATSNLTETRKYNSGRVKLPTRTHSQATATLAFHVRANETFSLTPRSQIWCEKNHVEPVRVSQAFSAALAMEWPPDFPRYRTQARERRLRGGRTWHALCVPVMHAHHFKTYLAKTIPNRV